MDRLVKASPSNKTRERSKAGLTPFVSLTNEEMEMLEKIIELPQREIEIVQDITQAINNQQPDPYQIDDPSRRVFMALMTEKALTYGSAGIALKAIMQAREAKAAEECDPSLIPIIQMQMNEIAIATSIQHFSKQLDINLMNKKLTFKEKDIDYNVYGVVKNAIISKTNLVFNHDYNVYGVITGASLNGNTISFDRDYNVYGVITGASINGNTITFDRDHNVYGVVKNAIISKTNLVFNHDYNVYGVITGASSNGNTITFDRDYNVYGVVKNAIISKTNLVFNHDYNVYGIIKRIKLEDL